MSINITLENGSKAPIYKQLVEKFEDAIRSGKLKPGELIPSMNDLIKRLLFQSKSGLIKIPT